MQAEDLLRRGLRDVLVYCTDYKCAHWVKLNADRWPDELRISVSNMVSPLLRAPTLVEA